MRIAMGLTVLTFAALGGLPGSAAPASAEEWCGFHETANAVVECGYSSLAECQQKVSNNNAVCIPDPSFASNTRQRPTPSQG